LKTQRIEEVVTAIITLFYRLLEDNNILLENIELVRSLASSFMEKALTQEARFIYILMVILRYIRFVSFLCTCNGKGLLANQLYISEILFGIHKDLVFSTFNRDGEVMVKADGEEMTLLSFCEKADTKRYNFFKSSLRLLAKLCVGRNYLCMEIIKKRIDFDTCLLALQDDRLPSTIRSKYCELLLRYYSISF